MLLLIHVLTSTTVYLNCHWNKDMQGWIHWTYIMDVFTYPCPKLIAALAEALKDSGWFAMRENGTVHKILTLNISCTSNLSHFHIYIYIYIVCHPYYFHCVLFPDPEPSEMVPVTSYIDYKDCLLQWRHTCASWRHKVTTSRLCDQHDIIKSPICLFWGQYLNIFSKADYSIRSSFD